MRGILIIRKQHVSYYMSSWSWHSESFKKSWAWWFVDFVSHQDSEPSQCGNRLSLWSACLLCRIIWLRNFSSCAYRNNIFCHRTLTHLAHHLWFGFVILFANYISFPSKVLSITSQKDNKWNVLHLMQHKMREARILGCL